MICRAFDSFAPAHSAYGLPVYLAQRPLGSVLLNPENVRGWHRRPTILTAHGRRMLEDARAKKRRLNPARGQRRNFGKLNGRGRCADQRRMSSMIVAAGSNHGHRAVVLDAIRVVVDALMQLRRSTQRERPKEWRENANCNKCASMIS